MQIIIKDLTKEIHETRPLKQIEFTSCLQANKNKEGNYHFYSGLYKTGQGFSPNESVSLVAKNVVGGLDLIIVDGNVAFLGHWNDGVL